MPTSFTGGCICGTVRYECFAEPVVTANCHCRDCQKAGGSPFASFVAVPTAALRLAGEMKYYDTIGDSGKTVSRGFCPNCGARLLGRSKASPDVTVILAGSLDDPNWYRPALDIFTATAQPWVNMNPELPKFEKEPKQLTER